MSTKTYYISKHVHNRESFYEEIAKVCEFPDYFGKNLDALNDCLGDMARTSKEPIRIYYVDDTLDFNWFISQVETMCKDHNIEFKRFSAQPITDETIEYLKKHGASSRLINWVESIRDDIPTKPSVWRRLLTLFRGSK